VVLFVFLKTKIELPTAIEQSAVLLEPATVYTTEPEPLPPVTPSTID
jgi:hypothetical protein